MKRSILSLNAALFFLSTIAHGHHSISGFESGGWQEIEGVVTRLSWRNPHLALVIRVTAEDGSTQDWDVEGPAVNTLMRRGLTRESFGVGQRLRLGGRPSLSGTSEMLATNVQVSTGQEFIMSALGGALRWTSAQPVPDAGIAAAEDIFRVWSFNANAPRGLVKDLVLTDEARAAMEGYDPATDQPSLRCIAPGMPNAMLNPYPIQFINEGSQVRLKIEEWDAERIIHLNVDAVPDDAARTALGYSIGSFDGNTFEVFTSRLDSPYLDDSGVPMSARAQIYEKFTLIPDEGVLGYEVTVTDPINLGEPATWTVSRRWEPDAVLLPFECVAG